MRWWPAYTEEGCSRWTIYGNYTKTAGLFFLGPGLAFDWYGNKSHDFEMQRLLLTANDPISIILLI
jgi:hypothetical protein